MYVVLGASTLGIMGCIQGWLMHIALEHNGEFVRVGCKRSFGFGNVAIHCWEWCSKKH